MIYVMPGYNWQGYYTNSIYFYDTGPGGDGGAGNPWSTYNIQGKCPQFQQSTYCWGCHQINESEILIFGGNQQNAYRFNVEADSITKT